MTSDHERERLRQTFECSAAIYQRARPDYPDELIDRLISLTGVRAGDRVLEIGCATGKATVPLARRGFRMTCVELGPNLAALARRNLSAFADVQIIEGTFEHWALPPDAFDLVVAATAWHWVDPTVRYQKAWDALRTDGHLAFWDALHVVPDDGDPFFTEIQDVYEQIGEGLPEGSAWLRPGELEERTEEIRVSGLFEAVDIHHFDWERVYDADGYIELLDTFSGHIAMEPWQRDRLYGAIRARLAERPDGRLRRHWGAVLHIAKRRA